MSFDRRPDGVSDENWAKLKSDVQGPAKAALLYLAILPGNLAMTKQPRDCAAAEVAYAKALADYPDNSTISFNMGTALSCLKKNAAAVYAFARAAVLDPTLGGTKDPKQTLATVDGAGDLSAWKRRGAGATEAAGEAVAPAARGLHDQNGDPDPRGERSGV